MTIKKGKHRLNFSSKRVQLCNTTVPKLRNRANSLRVHQGVLAVIQLVYVLLLRVSGHDYMSESQSIYFIFIV